MPSFEGFVRSGLCVMVCACMLSAHGQQLEQPSNQPHRSWFSGFLHLPIDAFHAIASLFQPPSQPEPLASVAAAPEMPSDMALETPLPEPEPAEPVAACSVSPLDAIEDPEAQRLEASVTSNVDVDSMQPAAAQALGRFESKVAAVGGTITLKSAYRPAAYQKHLQDVWYKWMTELRKNDDPACQDLRAQVEEEFTRHRLIETQHPVAVSDHTRGLAFDATVDLPAKARLGRRRVTVDTLARLAGLLRPAILADPVHFKFMGRAPSARHRRNA